MKKITTDYLVKSAMIAALYVAVTLVFQPISYGQIQLRISEIFILFVFIDPLYIFGLTLGCALANMFSPMGLVDVVFGTTATFMALIFIAHIRKKIGYNFKSLVIASIGPVISNGIIIGLELYYLFQLPLLLSVLYVAAGELLVVSILGVFIFKTMMHNEKFIEIITIK